MSCDPRAGFRCLFKISTDVGSVESALQRSRFTGRNVSSMKAESIIIDELGGSESMLIGSRMRFRSASAACRLIFEHFPSHLVVTFLSPGFRHCKRHQGEPSRYRSFFKEPF